MFRLHPITGDSIVYAPERSERPHAFGEGDDPERCAFCPGHECDTPPTIAAAGDPWRVRVIANKYPALEGAEVIIDAPHHEATFDRIDHADEAVRVYVARYRAHADAAHVSLFKNQGPRSGASIPHMHSQVMPLPFLPPRIRHEGESFARCATCPLCKRVDGAVIRETASFTWLTPAGSGMPYQQWIVPKRHVSEMTTFDDTEIAELAALLQSASAAMLTLGDSYNWTFLNFARLAAAHCYVELFPRLTTLFGGFEIGTGSFVQILDPAIAAERLTKAANQ
jgi:UDPglucose--hexose-1-phosphate uridylyltransferase